MKEVSIGICDYPSALKSAVFGLEEIFTLANRVCQDKGIEVRFVPAIIRASELPTNHFMLILLPPSSLDDYYLEPQQVLIDWLKDHYAQGSVLASACAGVFIVAATQLFGDREVTTHWALSDSFNHMFPNIPLNINKILIDHGDVVTAGGMMSWLDLGFELIAKYSSRAVVRQLGKTLVIDTARRKQSYYQQFTPSFSHGDLVIVKAQQILHQRYSSSLAINQLAQQVNLTVRTMQRRFLKATGLTPNQYLQHLRIQNACNHLESSQDSFEWIANLVGYEDVSACRKAFINIMGITPREFRKRFGCITCEREKRTT